MRRPLRGFRERRQAQLLQDALERYERAVSDGTEPAQARADAGAGLDELTRSFVLATSMGDAAAQVEPDAAFSRRVAMQLRSAQVVARPAARRRAPRFGAAPFAAAAAVLAAALVLIPSFGALPGEPLYAVKGAAEEARVWFATGPREARVRLSLASKRFEEIERLIDRTRLQVLGGPGAYAASFTAADIDDPELARLIEAALRDAGEQLEAAAEILTEVPAPQEDLDALVEVTSRGRALADDVAEELPNAEQRPVLRAAVKLAKIEAKAKAAQQMTAQAEPTPQPCPSPTPSSTPSPSPTPDASPTPSPSPTLTPPPDEAEPSSEAASDADVAEPSDPCATPQPSASPSPTVQAEPSAEPTPSASTEEQSATVEEPSDGEPSDVSEEPQENRSEPLSPFGERA